MATERQRVAIFSCCDGTCRCSMLSQLVASVVPYELPLSFPIALRRCTMGMRRRLSLCWTGDVIGDTCGGVPACCACMSLGV